MHKILKSRAGFTLIEILVVITIIGILLAAGGAAFINAQRSARDSERFKEITAIQDALEQYYAANGAYTAANTASTLAGLATAVGSSTYFPSGSVPTAPTGGGGVAYTFTNNSTAVTGATAYCVCATLEQTVRANATGNAAGVCTYTATNPTMFCVSNLQ
jgi:prepilin-type N-terminal cleavage/methylation domain-containing protein